VSSGGEILVVANPVSGGGRGHTLGEKAAALLHERGVEARLAFTTGPGDAERIAREARQQSGAARAVVIEPAMRLDEAASRPRGGTAVFFHEERAGAEALHEILAGADGPVTVLIGPEGGLSPREAALLEAAGFRRAWLGDGVLRTETAALYALAAVGTIVRERQQWKPSREG